MGWGGVLALSPPHAAGLRGVLCSHWKMDLSREFEITSTLTIDTADLPILVASTGKSAVG